MSFEIPTLEDIYTTHKRINPLINKTPVLTSSSINKILGTSISFKCENFQKVGAFKFRGATNACLLLEKENIKNGVTTHSSGNHAAALSLAAKQLNTPAYIVMPENAPLIKKKAVAGYGAQITYCKATLKDRETTLKQIQKKTNATFIHPYDNFDIISGQATCVKELLKENPDLDTIIVPIGGGGLMSGTALYCKLTNPKLKIFGAEPLMANDAYKSYKKGKLILADSPKTIADGLLTSLSPLTFEIIKNNVDDIFTVSEQSIIEAMRMVWERMKIIIEPSSAVPLAAIIENKTIFRNQKVGIIISGGNIDLENLPFKP